MTAKTAKTPAKKPKTPKANTKAAAKTAKKPAVKAEAAEKPRQLPAQKADPKRTLRLWNIRLGVVLLVLAAAVVVAGDSSSVPLTTQYLAKDALASEAAGSGVLAPATRHLMDVPISWLVAKFLIITGGVHLLAATLWRKRYEAWLDRGVNYVRWIGFGLAGGVAVASIAMLGGVSDLATLLLIFGSVALASVFAAVLEVGPGRHLQRLLAAGALAGLVLPWLGFMANVTGALKYGGTVPVYLYFVYAVVTLWFVAVSLATHFRISRQGRWGDVLYAERAFMLLGFAAAVVLALQIFAGALQS